MLLADKTLKPRRRVKTNPTSNAEQKGQLMSPTDFHIVRGDFVELLAGKDKGRQGKVKRVIRAENRIIVVSLKALPPLHHHHYQCRQELASLVRDCVRPCLCVCVYV
eukprot:SAG11_NODE_10199_length_847_cov_2.512032_2_plen_107_part_00